MRKRFCRSFDFELQATADDDGFILSLGPQHSFPLESMFPMINRENVRSLLEQKEDLKGRRFLPGVTVQRLRWGIWGVVVGGWAIIGILWWLGLL